jgi:DUF4097 and DUF4098 domain-containing protein YvlB
MNKELILMKTLTLVVALTAAAALCRAQEGSPDRVTVPLADPSRPAKLIVSCVNGRITVHAGANREIAVEAKGGADKHRNAERDGLRRIETAGSGLSIDQAENVVTVTTHSFMTNADLSFRVPANTALKLKSVMGDVNIDGVSGDIEVESTNGRMTLTNVSGAALVHGINGGIVATFTQIPPDKPMSFSSLNGDIDVTLPADTRARLKMKTNNGDAYSDFDISLAPQNAVIEDTGDSRRGRRHISIEHATTGTINGGGPEIQLVTFNGNIKIRKSK